jgi:hypothetical protein
MTILEDTNAKQSENGTSHSSGPRLTRPTLARESPIRNWSTLFGPPALGAMPPGGVGAHAGSPPEVPGALPGPMAQTLSDAVGQGYRVINDYLSQGQRYAEAMRWPDVASAASSTSGQDPQQLLKRLMQYGSDFAGVWFEVWSRMGWPSPGAWPVTPGASVPGAPAPTGFPGFPGFPGSAARDAASPFTEPVRSNTAPEGAGLTPEQPGLRAQRAAPAADVGPERFLVSVASQRRVQSVLELRRGAWTSLLAHALRPEGHDAPAIRGVTIEALPEQSTVRVSVEVPADQPPGVYNGMIIDAASNVPRGTLTITVEPSSRE